MIDCFEVFVFEKYFLKLLRYIMLLCWKIQRNYNSSCQCIIFLRLSITTCNNISNSPKYRWSSSNVWWSSILQDFLWLYFKSALSGVVNIRHIMHFAKGEFHARLPGSAFFISAQLKLYQLSRNERGEISAWWMCIYPFNSNTAREAKRVHNAYVWKNFHNKTHEHLDGVSRIL